MSASVLTEQLGPEGRRRVRIATLVGGAVALSLFALLLAQLWREGQFDGRLWEQYWDVETEWPQFLVTGLWGTVQGAIGAMILASVLGLVLALGRLSRRLPIRFVSGVIIDVFRGPPVLLFIYFSFFALPQVLPGGLGAAISRSQLLALVIGLTAYHMAVLAEVFRAGILSLDRGQREAAFAVGMTHGQAMRLVVLPQALRRMIPAIVAQLATLTKDTSLGFVIALSDDVLGRARAFAQGGVTNDLQAYIGAGVLYFVLIWGLTRLARRLEVQQRRKLGAGAIHVEGEADVEAIAEDAKA